MVGRTGMERAALRFGDMSFNLKKLTGPGPVVEAFNRLVDAVQSLSPISSPGVLTNRTTRGVSRVANAVGGGSATGIEEFTFVKEYDDFISCEDETGGTVYVAKPRTLQSSLWNPGFVAGTGVPGPQLLSSQTGGNDFYTYGRALRYLNCNARWRIKFTDTTGLFTIERMRTNDTDNSGKGAILYEVVREQIYPSYCTGVSVTSGASGNTDDLSVIFAAKLRRSTMVTTEQLDSLGDVEVEAGIQITYIDLNVDCRTWQPLHVMHHNHLFEIQGNPTTNYSRSVPYVDNQGADQTDVNANPVIFNTSINGFGGFNP